MPEFYTTNAIYDYIIDHNIPGFAFAKGNLWLMVYGTGDGEPRLMVALSAVSGAEFGCLRLLDREAEIMGAARQFAERSGLKLYVVRYSTDEQALRQVQLLSPERGLSAQRPIEVVRTLFAENGMSVPQAGTAKAVNDRVSNSFHQWQRNNLGHDITASDVDLIRVRDGAPCAIYELKRSFYALEDWAPYPRDFANFKLVANFARLAGVEFQIVYNQRTKEPFCDDISRLRRFAFSPEEERADPIDIVTLEQFITGRMGEDS